MPMNALETALQGKRTEVAAHLCKAFRLSDKKWQLVLSDGGRAPSRYTVDAGDQRAALALRRRRAVAWWTK